jgi:hypothetical protein
MAHPLHPDVKASGSALAILDFSFVLNGTGAISLATSAAGTQLRGAGAILPGGSIVYQASTGLYLITLGLNQTYRYITAKFAEIEDASSSDGARAVLGAPANEGTNSQITIPLATYSAAGSLTNYTSRRCSVVLFMKNSSA